MSFLSNKLPRVVLHKLVLWLLMTQTNGLDRDTCPGLISLMETRNVRSNDRAPLEEKAVYCVDWDGLSMSDVPEKKWLTTASGENLKVEGATVDLIFCWPKQNKYMAKAFLIMMPNYKTYIEYARCKIKSWEAACKAQHGAGNWRVQPGGIGEANNYFIPFLLKQYDRKKFDTSNRMMPYRIDPSILPRHDLIFASVFARGRMNITRPAYEHRPTPVSSQNAIQYPTWHRTRNFDQEYTWMDLRNLPSYCYATPSTAYDKYKKPFQRNLGPIKVFCVNGNWRWRHYPLRSEYETDPNFVEKMKKDKPSEYTAMNEAYGDYSKYVDGPPEEYYFCNRWYIRRFIIKLPNGLYDPEYARCKIKIWQDMCCQQLGTIENNWQVQPEILSNDKFNPFGIPHCPFEDFECVKFVKVTYAAATVRYKYTKNLNHNEHMSYFTEQDEADLRRNPRICRQKYGWQRRYGRKPTNSVKPVVPFATEDLISIRKG